MTRRLTLLNHTGDTTIAWSEDRDAEMEEIIRKKMAAGVTFFIVDRGGSRMSCSITNPADAKKFRKLAIPDEDILKFVESGGGEVTAAPKEKVKKSRVSKDAKEIAKSESIGVQQRKGG
jgi:hypothetical protein